MTTEPYTPAQVPERLFADAEAENRWQARFHAARMSLPGWPLDAPDACVYVSNASGVWEVYTWDRRTGEHRRVTDRPNGTLHATLSPDGKWVWWFNDTDGDEFGSWRRQPFTGDHTDAVPALNEVPDGYPAGLEIGERLTAAGVSTDEGSRLYAVTAEGTECFYENADDASVAALSRDETLLAISHSEHGDSRHPAVRVLTTAGFGTVADKWDGQGKGLTPLSFSPVAGDQRLLVLHERRGREELLVWDTATDTETELPLDLPGEVVADWYPAADALLVVHFHQGRSSLHRYDLATGELTALDNPAGSIGNASVRPDGTVEYSWSSGAEPSSIRARTPDGDDRILLSPPGDRAPGSAAIGDAFVEGAGGRIHALISRPVDAPDGPLPTVFNLHGGPHSADEDRFSAYRATWLDAGFAVVEVNYRGSTGYGSAWRDAIEGRPGLTELEDVAAVHDWAVGSGLADPKRCVVNGGSWGGYLTLLALGTQPTRWAAGVAAVPVADYVAAYEDEMEQLRSFDRALFGGSPEDVPAVYDECSPITYVEAVAAPVLVLAGDNDPRCPIRQIENYLDRLRRRDAPYEFYRYDAGHGSLVIAETIKQTAIEVGFARRALGME
ncbi:prolyl oligopeptidase family serine peptidase [Amycolatopsis suaedae]|uniref:S9 family peptidase n=1 Tax=Amycolatopsis suaedae TaxID=2510978 RepID=A0A4Q7JDD3_9PSEU|nr:prolyl oligopeptidase family serine peptidase [Amycolatopsis suaedae]RZQ65409.1 S9 family peptidase [Amycolatopsis suaedae]